VELIRDRYPVRGSHEPGNRVVGEAFSAFISPEMFARDIDLLAARLGLSEVQVGHRGKESSMVLWFETVDPQGIVWDRGNPGAGLGWWGIRVGRCMLRRPVFVFR
jgi:hypothetical protein